MRLSKGQSLRQVNANPTIAEKWRLQPHEGFCQLHPRPPPLHLYSFIQSFINCFLSVRALLSALLLAVHVANNGLWPFLGRL
jgi:hypothetical protein